MNPRDLLDTLAKGMADLKIEVKAPNLASCVREFSGKSPDRRTTSSRDNRKLKCERIKVADLNIEIWATTLKHPDWDTSQFRDNGKSTHKWTKDGKPICSFCNKIGHRSSRCYKKIASEAAQENKSAQN